MMIPGFGFALSIAAQAAQCEAMSAMLKLEMENTMEDDRKFDIDCPHGHVYIWGGAEYPARVICSDAKGGRPIAFLWTINGQEFHGMMFGNGLADHEDFGWENTARLVNAPAPKREIWVNEYPDFLGRSHDTRAEADESASPERIRCIRFVEADE